jgi:hypothetical protein
VVERHTQHGETESATPAGRPGLERVIVARISKGRWEKTGFVGIGGVGGVGGVRGAPSPQAAPVLVPAYLRIPGP